MSKTATGWRKVSEFELNLKIACWIRNNDKERIKLWNKFIKLDKHNQISTEDKLQRIENLLKEKNK